MTPIKVLWVDDEIELLKPIFYFLRVRAITPLPVTMAKMRY